VHKPTPGTPGGGWSTSCGPNGCPTPAPATPPAPGSPLGPSNAGAGGPGGPGHAGGSGAARLNAAGSTDPNTTGPVTGGPRQNTLDPNQSLKTARGPPPGPDPTNASTAITSGPVRPSPGRPNDDGGFFGAVHRTWDSLVGTNVANEPHDGGYVPAHGNTPAQVDEGRVNSVDVVEREADVFGYIPATAPEGRIAGGAIRGLKELYAGGEHAPQGPTSIPITGTPRGEPSTSGGPGHGPDPVSTNPPATGANPGKTSPPTADPGPGRIINRPGTTPAARAQGRPDRPTTAPAGRPRPGADVRPSGPATSRPGQRVSGPRTDRDPALIGSGSPTKPATGGGSPQARTAPGTRTAPSRPQAPRIDDPAPARPVPTTRPAPDTAPGGQPDLPTPAPTTTRSHPGADTDTGTGVPTTPLQRPVGQSSGPETDHNPHQPVTRPGSQPDGPPTVGGGEKARANRYHDGQLHQWDDQQQRWRPIAQADSGGSEEPSGVSAGGNRPLAAAGAGQRPTPTGEPERLTDQPGPGYRGPAASSAGTGGQPWLRRQDDDFHSPLNHKNIRKSHFDEEGNFAPANPYGQTTIVQHIVGKGENIKGNSPYTSWSPERASPKDFGTNYVKLDLPRLQSDIAAGKVNEVEIIPQERIRQEIQASADEIAGRPVDVSLPVDASDTEVQNLAKSFGLSRKATERITQRIVDMKNTTRDQEWLIRGTIPGRYISGPHGKK